ncbi:MAG: relaxase domain-containing protein, partial [Pseudomonadota bacterium]|nr:relaxase domain-containing protein [Pseudomonadota bacterium]
MLTVAKISASKSEALTQYYERTAGREDYYQKGGEPPGQWLGKGAENLGLAGTIEEGELGKIMAGFHPKTGEALTPNAGEDDRAPAWDCTFSAPKTVSAEWAVAGREVQLEIQKAHDQAVKAATEYLEREAVHARRGHAGENREKVKGIVAATYQHSTNRNGDPQLHTHTLIMNMGERLDGSRGNIDLDTRHKMTAGALYRAELAENLREKGFQIEREGDSFGIKGVPDDLTKIWSSRHAEIKNAMKAAGTSGYLASIQASLQTRAAKGEINRQEFMQDWKKQAAELGFTQKKAENLKNDSPGKVLNKPDADQILQSLTEQQSTFSSIQVLHEAAKAAQGAGMTAKDAETFAEKALSREDVIRLENQKGEVRYTTREMLDLEKRMADTALKMKENTTHRISNQIIEEAVKGKGLSDEQLAAIHHITHETGAIAAVEGWAGTGKSTMLNAAREAWEQAGYEVKGAALAGKAAEGLEQSAGIQSQTIHSLIKEIERGQAVLDKKTVLVVDEAGMIGSRQMEKLVRACDKAGAKLVLVGDSKQLQAIDAGAAFRAIADKIGRFEMQDVKRQQHAADREMAKAFREGRAGAALQNL